MFKNEIIQFGMIRSGSTLVYNLLIDLFPQKKIYKTHRYPSKFQQFLNVPIVCTFRDPLDIICSSIKRYNLQPSKEVINNQVRELELNGLNAFIELDRNYSNKLILSYEKFRGNFNFIFDELEIFFKITIDIDKRTDLKNKYSISAVKKKVSKFKTFQEFDKQSQFHGSHISDTNGEIGSYLKFFNNEDITFLKKKFRIFREKYCQN